ncbi:MAG: PDZ domain-containing protein, partial [Candidatus Omnitrophica bacterium]|nr:PDZ domain-containing protein [Candidatus Omnitrophota bacterium]
MIKGIVLEKYTDRVILSIPCGKATLLRKEIKKIVYDCAEQNFLEMGNEYLDAKRIDKAIECYEKALKIKPDFEKAKDAILRAQDHRGKIEERRKELLEQRQKRAQQREVAEKEQRRIHKLKLKETLGLEIEEYDDDIRAAFVYPYTPASKAGIEPGDIIVKIWDMAIKHRTLDKVFELLMGKKGSSVTLTIERQLSPVRKKIRWYEKSFVGVGISLNMEEKGLTVSDVRPGQPGDTAGLKPGDYITAIEGKSTLYMTLKEAVRNMKGEEGAALRLTVHRRIKVLRGGFGKQVKKISKKESIKKKPAKPRETGGIGIRISRVSDGIKVSAVFPKLPAKKAGIKNNDLFTRINGKPTKNMFIEQAVRLLSGKPDTYVRVAIERQVSIVRQKIPGTDIVGIGCALAMTDNGLKITEV